MAWDMAPLPLHPYSYLAPCKGDPPPLIQIWPSTRGVLGLWGRGCHYCIIPLGAQHPRYAVGLHHLLYPSSFCCITMVQNYYCIPNFKVPYCSPNLDSVSFAWFLITVCCKVGSSRYRRLLRSLSGISWAGDSPHHLFKIPTVSCIVCVVCVRLCVCCVFALCVVCVHVLCVFTCCVCSLVCVVCTCCVCVVCTCCVRVVTHARNESVYNFFAQLAMSGVAWAW